MKENIELLNDSEENLEWFNENYGELRERYENKMIAIKNKIVVASASNTEELLSKLIEKGIDESEVLIEVITPKNEISILWKG